MNKSTFIPIPGSAIAQALRGDQEAPCSPNETVELSVHLCASAATADIERVEQFLHDAGLEITAISPDTHIIWVTGKVAQLNAAFHIDICRFSGSGHNFRAYIGELSIPQELGGLVVGVFGIEDIQPFRPHSRVASATQVKQAYTPPQFASLYQFPTTLTGAGQSIALIELGGGYDIQVVKEYFSQTLGMSLPSVQDHSVCGATNCLACTTGAAAAAPSAAVSEVYLDIEVCASLAPDAAFHVYFCPATLNGFLSGVAQAITDNHDIISISWGAIEPDLPPSFVSSMNKLLAQAASKGISVCVSAGDNGASGYSQEAFMSDLENGLANAEFPASSPSVLACGGTSVEVTGNALTGETVWNDFSTGGGASGGGVSNVNPAPIYQTQNRVTFCSANPGGGTGRVIPDVAACADPACGYTVQTQSGTTIVMGGTSAVAPLWAALLARVNQHLGKRVGMIHPLLYSQQANGAAMRDITLGNNINQYGSPGYSALTGFDACTGWGSPHGANLMAAITAWMATSS